ncbi:MAG: hypothetical protein KAX16_02260, partial [Actinomycetia bacterium]|nr:hypothetical protein [Actinomycetes bacterium]
MEEEKIVEFLRVKRSAMKKNLVMSLIILIVLSFLAMTLMVMASPNTHEQKVFKLLNQERGRHGLQPLKN